MSPEEAQVVIAEWVRIVGAVSDDLYDLKVDALNALDADDPDVSQRTIGHIADNLAKTNGTLSKLLTDMAALQWSDADRDHAFTVIAGYVTQSNVERQARRDADLAKHKKMIEKAADTRIMESLLEAGQRMRAAEQASVAARKMSRDAIDYAASQVDVEIARRSAEIDARVEAEVQRRLYGDAVVDTRPGRKRPLVIG